MTVTRDVSVRSDWYQASPARDWDSVFDVLADSSLLTQRPGRALVVAPHPDDETLGAGGTLALLADAGWDLRLVLVTDGEASHPDAAPDEVAACRIGELEEAMRRLGLVPEVRRLRLPDGAVDRSAKMLRRLLEPEIATSDLVLTVVPTDVHRDHEAVGRACVDICRGQNVQCIGFPVWTLLRRSPEDPRFDIADARAMRLPVHVASAKARAIDAYASQVGGESSMIPPHVRALLDRDRELLVTLVEKAPSSGAPTVKLNESVAPQHFEALYAVPDPYALRERWYERRKRAITLASLPEQRYTSCLDVGCGEGVMSAELLGRCDNVTGVDGSATAIARARDAVSGATFALTRLPELPASASGPYDLCVLSEVGYYLTAIDLGTLCDEIDQRLAPSATLVSVHWSGNGIHFASTGRDVEELLHSRGSWVVHSQFEDPDFRVLVLRRTGTR